jgi:predicted nucleic acid-binding protein
MGTKYLMDTNAISDYLGGKLSPKGLDFIDEVMDTSPSISVINRIELLGHNRLEIKQFKMVVDACLVYDLSEEIILKTIAIRKSRSIKTPDAIIAATALVHNLTLITHNIRDFENISNLNLFDPHTL